MSRLQLSAWRRERLRTNLWLTPSIQVAVAVVLFAITYALDRAAARGSITLPSWVNNGSADAARQILTGIAAAVITVVGLVFSITIVALTLASQQFGPRMLRNFVRDVGTQLTLGTFVATFVYAVLALGSVAHGASRDFVPHLSITVAMGLMLLSLGVLIYFIHHIAESIQLPQVIASVAGDLQRAIDAEMLPPGQTAPVETIPTFDDAAPVLAGSSGYLQYVDYRELVAVAVAAGAVIELLYRPGHFVVEGLPVARVTPSSAADVVAQGLERTHVTGPHRTLTQDRAFGIDQLVEIGIRAISPAVNDPFTCMTCVDWLGDALCRITVRSNPGRVHRDARGEVRVVAADLPYARLVARAFDKVRQSGRGMPPILLRQLEALTRVAQVARTDGHRAALRAQAEMIMQAVDESVPDRPDREDARRRYDVCVAALGPG